MSAPERTPAGKWVVYRVSTGERFERWPVDARCLLACGEFAATPPDGGPIVAPSEPPRGQPAAMPVAPRLSPELEAIVGPTNVGGVVSVATPAVLPEPAPVAAPHRGPGRPRKAR